MTTQAENIFAPTLREIEGHLHLPDAKRLSILCELESDLEALFLQAIAEGFTPEEAQGRALAAVVPDWRSMKELGQIHRPLYDRLTQHLPPGRVRLLEHALSVVLVGAVLLTQGVSLVRVGLLRNPSPFMWPVLFVGAVLFGMVLGLAFRLWIRGDYERPRSGLGPILLVSGGVLTLGICGTLLDLYRVTAVLEKSPRIAEAIVSGWILRSSTLLSVAILVALAGVLAWSVLSHWLTRASNARSRLLGSSVNPPAIPRDCDV